MAGRTNELVAWTDAAGRPRLACPPTTTNTTPVVSSGEQITAGLLALVLRNQGVRARSWMGWQVPISSDGAHGKARISGVGADNLAASLAQGEVAVIAGFQGVAETGRVTTLGRGGSDTSAVAVAAALGAHCDIYTDVDGVYTTDPRIESKARRLSRISYEEMLELASLGAKVLQTRSVELAMAHRVPLRVLSSFVQPDGTWRPASGARVVCDEEGDRGDRIVSGVPTAATRPRSACWAAPAPWRPRRGFGGGGPTVNVDMIVQSAAAPRGGEHGVHRSKRDAPAQPELMRTPRPNSASRGPQRGRWPRSAPRA
jgi:aspartate kinase